MTNTNCPHCGVTLIGDEIPVALFKANPEFYPTMEDAVSGAKHYGWTNENRKTFTINCVYIKHVDNKVNNFWRCKCCGGTW